MNDKPLPDRIQSYLNQLSPHMVERMGNQLLRDALSELTQLHKNQSDSLVIAFVQGVKWWEYKKTGASAWQSDQSEAEQYAIELIETGSLGKPPPYHQCRKTT